ncbi:MAG: hypothetical protein AAFR68_02975 [Pseudomonadota bacterium]
MNNVIALNVPHRRQRLSERTGALIDIFAGQRRFGDDVFWLKENAELLNILECTGAKVDAFDLDVHAEFYAELPQRLSFFPQYYRFLLSLGLDLEDLGFEGSQSAALCQWVAQEGLPEAEFSDLQRAEARRLLARRGVETQAADPMLDDRLRAFLRRKATFALPNKKAAYELTHIVFYLSEYGRRDPMLDEDAITSLEYAGVLAYLDMNMDLLAEICIALRYAGRSPSAIWEDTVLRGLSDFAASTDPNVPVADDYHEYFVSTWLAAICGDEAVSTAVTCERTTFHRCDRGPGPLRIMSAAMFEMETMRSGDWQTMRPFLEDVVDEPGHGILADAEASIPDFGAFFEGFARARCAAV